MYQAPDCGLKHVAAQDASEYFQYLLSIMSKAERISGTRLGQTSEPSMSATAFEFGIETKVQCVESGRVSYKRDAPTNILSLNIPMDAAANKKQVDQYKASLGHPESSLLELKQSEPIFRAP